MPKQMPERMSGRMPEKYQIECHRRDGSKYLFEVLLLQGNIQHIIVWMIAARRFPQMTICFLRIEVMIIVSVYLDLVVNTLLVVCGALSLTFFHNT